MIEKAIYSKLNADSNVTDKLATYHDGEADERAAIFTVEIPEDADNICVRIEQVTALFHGTRGQRGSETFADVSIWADKLMSDSDLRNAADAVWTSLDRQTLPLTVDGYNQTLCLADNPVRITDPDGFPGFLVRCRVMFLLQ